MYISNAIRPLWGFLVVALSAMAPAPIAMAQTNPPADTMSTADDTVAAHTRTSAGNGALLMLAQSPTLRAQQGTAFGLAGYDSAAGTALFEAITEVHIWGPFSVRGGAVYTNSGQRLRPTVGARAQVLNAAAHGVDGAVGVFYRPEGLTEPEGEIEGVASIGRRVGAAYLIGNLAYGQDPEGNERDAEVRVAGIVPVGERLVLGLDSRVRVDLGSSSARLATTGEPAFDLLAGLASSIFVGPVAILVQAGPSARKVAGVSSYGVFAMAGVGAAF